MSTCPPAFSIRTEFQPIVSLRDGALMGVEALSRDATGQRSPRALFEDAEAAGRSLELEAACWDRALETAARVFRARAQWANLFINVQPPRLLAPGFLDGILLMMAQHRVEPSRVVVEITEGAPIDDYAALRECIAAMRTRGLRIAVDDAGAGHAGLQTIVELVPDIVKLDRSLVHGVAHDPKRRAALEAMVLLARRFGAAIVAEGVEEKDDLMEVRRLGVPYAQGYLLARPAPEPAELAPAVLALLQHVPPHGDPARHPEPFAFCAGDIFVPGEPVTPATTVAEVYHRIERTREEAVVICASERPIALLTRAALHRTLSAAYGRELWFERPAIELADPSPLIGDARCTLEELAQRATARTDAGRHDPIVITRDGLHLGTLPVLRLLEGLTALRVASARLEHPLTGLPGTLAIEQEIGRRCREAAPSAVLHVDLARFRPFNQRYGFHHGDRVIRLAAAALTEALEAHDPGGWFLGHVKGDDFVAICRADAADAMLRAAGEHFDAGVRALAPDTDRELDTFEAPDANGAVRRIAFPGLMAVTVLAGGEPVRDALAVLDELQAARQLARRFRRAA